MNFQRCLHTSRSLVLNTSFLQIIVLAICPCLLFRLVRTVYTLLVTPQNRTRSKGKWALSDGFQTQKLSISKATVHRCCCAPTMFLESSNQRCSAGGPVSKYPEHSMAEPRCCPPLVCVRRILLTNQNEVFFVYTYALSLGTPADCSLPNRLTTSVAA